MVVKVIAFPYVDGGNQPVPDPTIPWQLGYLSPVSEDGGGLSDESSSAPSLARSAAHQLESGLLGFRGGEELGIARTQTRALNQEAAGL